MIRPLIAAMAGVAAIGCHAAPFVHADMPTISRAVDVIEIPQQPIPVNTVVKFRRLDTAWATRVASQGFQVRLFRLPAEGSTPVPENGDAPIKDCDVYFTFVIGIGPSSDRDIEFTNIDYSWLSPSSSGRSVVDGHYFAVLERAGVSDQVFRLRHADQDRYFKQGFAFTVAGDDRLIDQVRKHYEETREAFGKLAAELRDAGDKLPCYQYVKYAGAAEAPAHDSTLQLCRADDADPATDRF